jgi:hypothetical protein
MWLTVELELSLFNRSARKKLVKAKGMEVKVHFRKILIALVMLYAQNSFSGQVCDGRKRAPDSRYSVNGNEVLDKATGLIWLRCPMGLTGEYCSDANGFNSKYISSYASYDGEVNAETAASIERDISGNNWRVPTKEELASLVETGCKSPAINTKIFPFNWGETIFWTSTLNRAKNEVIAIDFNHGVSFSYSPELRLSLRLVR